MTLSTIKVVTLTRINSRNVQDEGLRIGGIGRRMNSKAKISQTRRVSIINVMVNLAYVTSQDFIKFWSTFFVFELLC
jgi:hypothetical protein